MNFDERRADRRRPGFSVAAGAFYTCMAGIHVGVVAANPAVYASFGAATPFNWVSTAWATVFMANPKFWGLFAAALELLIGVLLLRGGQSAKLGWIAVVAFQLGLILLGWVYLVWIVPAIIIAVLAARHDWPQLSERSSTADPVSKTPR